MIITRNLLRLDGYVSYAIRNGIDTISQFMNNYLFITYIVTSKPKRISVAAGVVHIIFSLSNILCLIAQYNRIIRLCGFARHRIIIKGR
jgi:Na+/glutamate symporter